VIAFPQQPLPPDGLRYLRPIGLLSGQGARAALDAGWALPLASGPYAFAGLEAMLRPGKDEGAGRSVRCALPFSALPSGHALRVAPQHWAGLSLSRPLVMGIVNVTPDSFSDGGDHAEAQAAIAYGLALAGAGADILDIGGESTRPGAHPVPLQEEMRRVLPVVEALAARGLVVSIDTRRSAVMHAAVKAGARIINDVSGFTHDPESAGVVAAMGDGVALIAMHMQGEPATMQDHPSYRDVTLDVYDTLQASLDRLRCAGVAAGRVALDVGIGFGKTAAHNVQLLADLALFHGLGCPLVLGVSRKRFIAALARGEPAKDRLGGSLAAALTGLAQGCQIIRAHDVAATVQACAIWQAIHMP
jgi:dihydropteroate synthase